MVGPRIEERHANARGIAHGGVLVTMADIACGYNASYVGVAKRPGARPTAALTTASLAFDFAGSAIVGDWATNG